MGRKVGIIKPILLMEVVTVSFCSFYVSFLVEERQCEISLSMPKSRSQSPDALKVIHHIQESSCVPQIHNDPNKRCFLTPDERSMIQEVSKAVDQNVR